MDNKEQVINAVVEGIEKLAIDSTTSVSGTVSKYGPQVLDTAETYIRLVAIIKFIEIFIPFLVFSICLYYSVKLVKKSIDRVIKTVFFIGSFIMVSLPIMYGCFTHTLTYTGISLLFFPLFIFSWKILLDYLNGERR